MQYQMILPPPVLKNYVRHFWTVDSGDTIPLAQEVNTVVDDSSGIIFQHYNGCSSFIDQDNQRVKLGLLYGKRTAATRSVSDAPFSVTGVNFTSQGLKTLFGIDAIELTNQLADLRDFGENSIVEQLMEQRSQSDRINVLVKYLTSRIDAKRKQDELILHCCATIRSGAFNIRMRDLAGMYGITERQLERRFNQSIGLSPKFFMRMTRFQHALERIMKGDGRNLSDIAYALEYSDQSRFISDVRKFTNYPPGAVIKNMQKILLLGA